MKVLTSESQDVKTTVISVVVLSLLGLLLWYLAFTALTMEVKPGVKPEDDSIVWVERDIPVEVDPVSFTDERSNTWVSFRVVTIRHHQYVVIQRGGSGTCHLEGCTNVVHQ